MTTSFAGTRRAQRASVTHRLDVRKQPKAITLEFQGLLDDAALEELRTAVQLASRSAAEIRVLLRELTIVERGCIAGLRSLGAEVVAESPYLARWLREDASR
jgi:hypothetical protein